MDSVPTHFTEILKTILTSRKRSQSLSSLYIFKIFINIYWVTRKLLNANNSVWGISDTRVPTESRPGHIALFAGIYEDPSAIFTGWKKNLVEFDSVFNQTKYSIALGSPDIVDMFGDGVGREKIYYESYPASWQDFLRSDSYKLDTWVLDQLKNLVAKHSLPMHDKLLIFLHMLGVDNTGHAHKPNSE